MSPEIRFDPFNKLFSRAAGLMKSSDVRDLMSAAGRADVIAFSGGLPFVSGLPLQEITEVMDEVLNRDFAQALQYGDTAGLYCLRTQLALMMGEENIPASPEHIVATTGSQQALDLIARTFIDPGDLIVIEAPTYVGALTAFRPASPRALAVPLDDEGMRIDILEKELRKPENATPKFIYVVPNFHNPAGVTMSEERRVRLVEVARDRDLLIVEDNPYGMLRYEGDPLSPLAILAPERVLYVGTLSKVVFPGIRVGWAHGPMSIIEKLITLKQSADLCSSNLNQMFASSYLERGYWKGGLEVLNPIYASRRDTMLRALEKHFPPGCRWTRPGGGLFIWVTLPGYVDAAKMLPLAIEQKVTYVPGTAFYADGAGKNQMRLNFSFPPEERITEGISRIGKTLKKEMDLYRSLGLDHAD